MPVLTPEQLPILATSLIRLRGETLGRVAEATGIRIANLSVWLRGKEQVISAKRVVGLLHHLGVEGGRLRTDVLHRWQDCGALNDSKIVLAALLTNTQTVWLFQDDQPGLIKTHFLLADDALIRLEAEPGINQAPDLGAVARVGRVITTPTALAGVPVTALESTRHALLEIAEIAATGIGDEALLEGLMFRLSETVASNVASRHGWSQLEQALRFAFTEGAQPGDIAGVIDHYYRQGGKAGMPPNQ